MADLVIYVRSEDEIKTGKKEALIDEIKGKTKYSIKEHIDLIEADEKEIDVLNKKKNSTNNEKEKKEIQRQIDFRKSNISFRQKKIREYLNQVEYLKKLSNEYYDVRKKQRLDGNVTTPEEYTRDILNLLRDVLGLLGERLPVKLYEKILVTKQERIEKKFIKALEKLEKLGSGFSIEVLLYGKSLEHNSFYSLKDLRIDSKSIYKEILEKSISDRNLNLLDEEGKINLIYHGDLDKSVLSSGDFNFNGDLKEFFASHIKEIKEIQKLRELGYWNDFVDLENLYKEYANHYIGALVIKDLLPKLSKDPVHKSEIKRLEKIVEKHLKIAEKLKNKADKKFASLQEKLQKKNKIVESEKTQTSKEIETPQVVNVEVEVKEVETPQVVDTKQEQQKKEIKTDENELKSRSAGYRRRYIEEKIKNTNLGKMSYSEYLRNEYPDQKDLIEYVEGLEKKGKTLYEEYLKERAYRISNGYTLITFKEFVKLKTGKNYYDVDMELQTQIEEELKEMKAL